MSLLKASVFILSLTSATLLYLMVTEFNPFIRRCNPDVCHDYALSAFKVHSVRHTGANNCDYGVLPGFLSFNVMKPVGERWQTAMDKCKLQNLMAADAPLGSIKVLLLGDSVDAHMAQQWCMLLQQPLKMTPTGIKGSVASFAAAVKTKAAAAAGKKGGSNGSSSDSDPSKQPEEGCCKDRDKFYYCRPAAAAAGTNSISIGMFHLLGVHLDGPFHAGAKGNFLTRIPAALKTYNTTFGGPPDLVIIHSNFWDQSRMWEQQQPGYGHLNKLLPEVVFSWSSNFSLLLSTTREYLPEIALVATRTAAFPAFAANWLGRWQYVHQLNMAAMEVTRLHGMAVIDLGGMVFGLEPKQYLDDQHHPNKLVLLECANIALNLLVQQRKRLALERQGQQAVQEDDSMQGTPTDTTTTSSSSSSSTTVNTPAEAADSNPGGKSEVTQKAKPVSVERGAKQQPASGVQPAADSKATGSVTAVAPAATATRTTEASKTAKEAQPRQSKQPTKEQPLPPQDAG